MSPVKNIGVLAFASAALAIPHAEWQPFKRHNHLHQARQAPAGYSESELSSFSSAIPTWNSGSGYAAPTGTGYGTGSAYPSGFATGTSVAGAYCTSTYTSVCTETATKFYRSSTGYSLETITHTLTTSVPCSASAPVGPATTSSVPAGGVSSYPGGYGAGSSSYPAGAGSGSASAIPSYGNGAGGSGSCAQDVTVTTKVTETVTVTAGSESSSEAAAVSTSSYAAPAGYSSIGNKAHHPYHHHTPSSYEWTSTETAPTSTSVYVAPTTTSVYVAPTTSSVYVAPTTSSEAAPATTSEAAPSSYAAPSSSVAAPSSYAAASSSSAPAPSGGAFRGKRGIAFNDTTQIVNSFYDSTHIGWAYNWVSNPYGYSGSVPFIAALHGTSEVFTSVWSSDAQSAIDNGAEYLFSFNEPDQSSQANLSPQDAANAWMTHMEPFAGKAKLVAPSVTNGVGTGIGQDWLKQFLGNCSLCTIDAVNQHWYNSLGNDIGYFKAQVSAAASEFGKPVFVGEWGGIGDDTQLESFMSSVMSWMDSNDDIV